MAEVTYTYKRTSLTRSFIVSGLLLLSPLFVHAGVFDALLGFVAEADSAPVETADNPQTISLLHGGMGTDGALGGGDILVSEDGTLVPGGPGGGEVGDHSGEISEYVVREADSLSQIADMFGVSVNTILWANEIKDSNTIQPGDTLIILPVSGVRHVVKAGDTLKAIAAKYQGDIDDIVAYNLLTDTTNLVPGTTIVVPGGEVKSETPKKAAGKAAGGGGKYFIHPLPGSVRTQGIHGYNGVDLGASAGTPIRAAADGTVILSRSGGWNGGYGNYVVIKHGNGTQTLYAHNSSNAVATGETVTQGQVIGYVGSTGRSTGMHLHFEVRGATNPF